MFQEMPDRPAGHPTFRVAFDNFPPKTIHGLIHRTNTITMPDEHIIDNVLNFAQSIWHLKDRLDAWSKGTSRPFDAKKIYSQSLHLLVCSDLANSKKHGRSDDRSKLSPHLKPEIELDTSKSGLLELFYDGTRKEKELYVTNPSPILYKVKIFGKQKKIIADNAVAYLFEAFKLWIPAIKQLDVLQVGCPESEALIREIDIYIK